MPVASGGLPWQPTGQSQTDHAPPDDGTQAPPAQRYSVYPEINNLVMSGGPASEWNDYCSLSGLKLGNKTKTKQKTPVGVNFAYYPTMS